MQQICDAVKALLPTAASAAASVFTVKIKTKGRERGRKEELSLLRQQETPSVVQKILMRINILMEVQNEQKCGADIRDQSLN